MMARKRPFLERSSNDPPLLNLTLKNQSEAFLQERNKRALVCSQHKQKLDLYCQEDKEPICLACRDSEHQHHSFSPISETATGLRNDIIARLHSQEKNLKEIEDFKILCDKMAAHIKRQALRTEAHIKEEFEKLHQYLREEEVYRIADLKKEEEDKSKQMKERIEKTSQDAALLRERIQETKQDLSADEASFVLNFKRTDARTGVIRWTSHLDSLNLIDVVKHTGNLMFNVWKKMQITYIPVILDPNSAHPELAISNDLTSLVRTADLQPIPLQPGRFLYDVAVLGSEGFTSGTHYWDVDIFFKRHWLLGVVTESCLKSIRDNADFTKAGLWYLVKDHGEYTAGATPQPATTVNIKIENIPNIIRVRLDMECGKVSFSDPQKKKHLRSFKLSVGEKVFPYFATLCGREPLQILPMASSVTLQKRK